MSWRMMSLPLLILAALLVISPVSAQEVGDFTLTILHTNDTHSHIEEYDGSTTTCPAESEAAGLCIGGVARRATLLADLRLCARRQRHSDRCRRLVQRDAVLLRL